MTDNYIDQYISKKNNNILIVVDDERYRELMRVYLENEGYRVTESDNGHEAIKICKRKIFDLIILDVLMGELNGYETCKKIKSLSYPGFLPIIMLTALDGKREKLRAFKAGADDFLNKPVKKIELLVRVNSLLRIRYLSKEMENIENVLYTMINILETKDHYTRGHSERVAKLSKKIAGEMGLSRLEQKEIHKGGLLHDIGKIGINSNILLKRASLNQKEYMEIQRHPVMGEKICKPLNNLELVLPIIRHHHEKLDGSGYPDRLKADNINILVRIVSLVDVFDALTSKRSYRKRIDEDKALKIIKDEIAKNWWDEEIYYYLKKLSKNRGGYFEEINTI